jgi:hypothetical protein
LGAHAFLVMSGLCLTALPVAAGLREVALKPGRAAAAQ